MLSRERAQEMLKEFEAPDRTERAVKAISSLPQHLREAAFGILYRDGGGKPVTDWAKRSETLHAAAATLSKATPANRGRIFEALFSKIAMEVGQAWQLF